MVRQAVLGKGATVTRYQRRTEIVLVSRQVMPWVEGVPSGTIYRSDCMI